MCRVYLIICFVCNQKSSLKKYIDIIEIIIKKSNKGKNLALFCGYLYYLKRVNKTSTNWVCRRNSSCMPSITTMYGVVMQINSKKVEENQQIQFRHKDRHEPLNVNDLEVEVVVKVVKVDDVNVKIQDDVTKTLVIERFLL